MLYYKILNGHCDTVLTAAPGSSVTRGINCKLAKQTCSIDVRKILIAVELSTHGKVYLTLCIIN